MADFLPTDFSSPTWTRLKEHCQARLLALRTQNDKTLSADETAKVRGRIAEVKRILALDNPAPIEADDA